MSLAAEEENLQIKTSLFWFLEIFFLGSGIRLRPYRYCVVPNAAIVFAVAAAVGDAAVVFEAAAAATIALVAVWVPLSPPLLCASAVHADIVVVLLLLFRQRLFINPLDDLKSDVHHRVEADLLLLVGSSAAVAVVPAVAKKIIVKTVPTFLGLQLVFTTLAVASQTMF